MNDAAIALLANEILKQLIFQNWKIYLLMAAIWLLSFFIQKWILSYVSERGRAAGIAADFKTIIKNLEKTTDISKSIELKLSHEDWIAREYRVIRRTKLEELMLAVYATEAWSEKAITLTHHTEDFDVASSPITKVTMLALLYFPEMHDVCDKLFSLHGALIISIMDARIKLAPLKFEVDRWKIILDSKIASANERSNPAIDRCFEDWGNANILLMTEAGVQRGNYLAKHLEMTPYITRVSHAARDIMAKSLTSSEV